MASFKSNANGPDGTTLHMVKLLFLRNGIFLLDDVNLITLGEVPNATNYDEVRHTGLLCILGKLLEKLHIQSY